MTGKPCVRGNLSIRDKWGNCLCVDCKAYRYARQKVQKAEYRRQWQRANPDKLKAYQAKWVAANKKQRAEIVRSWRERNPSRVAAMSSRAGKKWATNNKGKRNASVKARQLAQRNRTPAWADLDKIREFYIEAERLTKTTGVPHEVDHIIPLQGETISGFHVHENLQVIPRFDNRSKRNRFEEAQSAS